MQNLAGRKGVKGLLLMGHEKVPHGSGLRAGDHGSDQLMVLGTSEGLLAEQGLLGGIGSLAELQTSVFS